MIALRPYQLEAIDSLRAGLRAGHKRQVLCMPTGGGKTLVSSFVIQEAAAKGSRAAFIVDRVSLIEQTSRTFDEYGIDHGIVQAQHWRAAPWQRIQVCSAQTLARRQFPGELNLIVVDECFPKGTLVLTPYGPVRIEVLREGDVVLNACGEGRIAGTMAMPAGRRMAIVRFEDGTEIRCTENHPFFTTRGWVAARKLAGEVAVRIEDVSDLWESVCAVPKTEQTRKLSIATGEVVANTDDLLQVLLQEVEKPDAPLRGPTKDEYYASAYWAPPEAKRREWTPADYRAVGAYQRAWVELADRICGENRPQVVGRVSTPLQDRRGQSNHEDCDRGGRRQPRVAGAAGSGPQKRRTTFGVRVVGVQVEECRSDETVYNLHVTGHPSYFAGERLVHNCHTLYKSTVDFIKANPNVAVLGLTATPFTKGLGKIFTNVVNVTTTDKLVEEGFLAPLKAYAAKRMDMTGARIKFDGEWNEEDIEKRGMEIVGDVVQGWIEKTEHHFGGPVKTIVFSATVAHGEELCRKFQAAGFNFQQVSYKDGNDEKRRRLIEEFRKPDSEVCGLISVEALAKGFDVPDIMCGVSCRPYRKSLSGHIQTMGRVMRPYPGKDFALWLDHAGNYLRFSDDTLAFFAHGVHDLNDQDLDSKERKEPDQYEADFACHQCKFIMAKSDLCCPSCGWVRPKRKSEIEHEPGELVSIDLKKAKKDDWLQDRRSIWRQIVTLAKETKGDDLVRAEKWALAQFKNLYGDWPVRGSFHFVDPMEPSAQLVRKLKSLTIAYFKGRAKAEARA